MGNYVFRTESLLAELRRNASLEPSRTTTTSAETS